MWKNSSQLRECTSKRINLGCLLIHLAALITLLQSSGYAADDVETAHGSGEAIQGDAAIERRLTEIDKALLLELVKLAKFNVHFHLEANRHQKWRDFTYPAARESGTAVSLAATLIDLRQQVRGLDNPKLISKNELRNAVRCSIVGNAISGGASALELTQNTWEMWKATKNGYSPASSLAFVKTIVAKTDQLLDERDKLATEEQSLRKQQVMNLETRLVRRIRQQLLFEFGTWSCHSRDQAWRENTFYTIDALQSFSKMNAGIITMRAFQRPKLARDAVIWGLMGNSAATINPIFKNFVGFAVRKHQKHKLEKEIPFERPPLSSELDELQEKLAKRSEETWLQKVATLNYRTERMDVNLDREIGEIEHYRQIAQQQSISGPLIGLTGVTSSTLATIAAYGYFTDVKTGIRLGFAGRITQDTGQALALLGTPYTMIRGMIKKERLRRRGELPSQILEERLKRLDTLSPY